MTEIDPRIVRKIAFAAHRGAAPGESRDERVEAALIASGVAGPVLGEKFDAWSKAVGAEYERLTAAAVGATSPTAAAMSDERVTELHKRAASTGLRYGEVAELFKEMERLRKREVALVDEVDEQAEQLRRMGAELARCTDLNRDLVATNTNQAETLKEAREQIRDRDYVNANLRKSIEQYRAQLAETGETELEWGVRSASRATGRTEDISQPSEESARARVARSNGSSVLICRTKAGLWREAEQEG